MNFLSWSKKRAFRRWMTFATIGAALICLSCKSSSGPQPSAKEEAKPASETTPKKIEVKSLPSDRYKWIRKDAPPVQASGIEVLGKAWGRIDVRQAPNGLGLAPFVGNDIVIDTPGSSDIRIQIDPKVGRTPYGGLTFTAASVLAILEDGTLLADREGIVARDSKGTRWTTSKVIAGKRETYVF